MDEDDRIRKEEKAWEKSQQKKTNKIVPNAPQQAQDADEVFKQETVAEMLKKDKYRKNHKLLQIPKDFDKNIKGLESFRSGQPGLSGNDSHQASASEIGLKSNAAHSHGHDHAHAEEKSLKRQQLEALSYSKLMLFLNENHPRKVLKDQDEGNVDSDDEKQKVVEKTDDQKLEEMVRSDVKFGIFDDIGTHCYCSCFNKQKITPMAHQIGLGSTLFLLATKALSQFFFFLTILHIPVYFFYHNANPIQLTKPEFLGIFSSLSLGNVAQGRGSCRSLNIASDNVIDLKCPSGSLDNILYYGFSKENQASCMNIKSAKDPKSYFQKECIQHYEQAKGESAEDEANRIQVLGEMEKYYYTYCFGKESCSITIDTGLHKLGVGKDPKDDQSKTESTDDKTKSDSKSSSSSKDSSDSKDSKDSSDKSAGSSSSAGSKADDSKSTTDKTTKPVDSSKDSSSSSDSSASDKDAGKAAAGGKARLLAKTSIVSDGGVHTVDEVDMLSQLSPVCKSIVLGRVYKSKYSDQPTKDKIKNSGLKIDNTAGNLTPEPYLVFMAKCKQTNIVFSQRGYSFTYKKEDLGIIVVFIDFAVIISFIYFVFFLNRSQDSYIEAFADQTLELSDFALEFSNIPSEEYYDGSETILRAIMWERLQDIMRDQLEEDTGREQYNFDKMELYNIVDITFASTDTKDIEHLTELKQLHDKLTSLQKELEAKGMLHEHNEDEFHTHKGKWDFLPCCPGARIDKVEKEFAETQKKYIHAKAHYKQFHDEKSKSGRHLVVEVENQDEKLACESAPGKRSFTKAYVTFKSMTALTMMQNAFSYSKVYRVTLNIFKCCCQSRYNKMRMREFQGRWPHPRVPDLPDNIQWQNMGVVGWNQFARTVFAWGVSILIIIGAFVAILIFKNLATFVDGSQFKLIPVKHCSHESDPSLMDMILEKNLAWLDYKKPPTEQSGLMGCYCFEKLKFFKYDYAKLKNISFDLYKGKTPLCTEWFEIWALSGFCKVAGPMFVLGINLVVPMTIDALSHFQRLYTHNDQTMSTFLKVTFLMYFNVAVVVMLVNFDLSVPILNEGGILKGDYKDFSARWYENIGANICYTLLIMVFTPQISKLFVDPAKFAFKRFYDREYKISTSKPTVHKHKDKTSHHIAENEDAVNSLQLTQEKLNDMYLGPEIKAFFIYAQQFTSLWCIMTYSSGMPILYPIGCLNFMVLYFTYKTLLLKFYSKTKAFNQVLPQTSIHYFKIGIVFHIMVGMWVFSNGNVLSTSNTKSIKWFQQHIVDDKKYINVEKYPIMQRFIDGVGFLYFIFGLLILALIVLQLVLTTVFSRLFRLIYLFLTCGGEKGRQEILDEQEIEKNKQNVGEDGEIGSYSDNFIQDLKLNPLKQFYNRSNKELDIMNDRWTDMEKENQDFKVQQKEMKKKNQHYTDEEQEAFDKFEEKYARNVYVHKKMQERKINFYSVFRHHIEVLVYETGPKTESMLLNLTPDQQLDFIERNFDLIQRSKKTTNSLRMEGICQSYNAKDSALYRDLTFMQKILDKGEDKLTEKHVHHDHGHHGDHNDEEKNPEPSINGSITGQNNSNTELMGLYNRDKDEHIKSIGQIKPHSGITLPPIVTSPKGNPINSLARVSEISNSPNKQGPILINSSSQEVLQGRAVNAAPQFGSYDTKGMNDMRATGNGTETLEPRQQNSILTPISQGNTIANEFTEGNNSKPSPVNNKLNVLDE